MFYSESVNKRRLNVNFDWKLDFFLLNILCHSYTFECFHLTLTPSFGLTNGSELTKKQDTNAKIGVKTLSLSNMLTNIQLKKTARNVFYFF